MSEPQHNVTLKVYALHDDSVLVALFTTDNLARVSLALHAAGADHGRRTFIITECEVLDRPLPPRPEPASAHSVPWSELSVDERALIRAVGWERHHDLQAQADAAIDQLDLPAQFAAEGRTRWSEADTEGNVTVTERDEPSTGEQ
jgi:hypothetical protein